MLLDDDGSAWCQPSVVIFSFCLPQRQVVVVMIILIIIIVMVPVDSGASVLHSDMQI
jgi:hypothetical protein